MAGNMMEILKQIQRDLAGQKLYMRNLHVLTNNTNEKYNLLEGKITELDNKTNKQDNKHQQVLETVERLEQQINKQNMILIGNDTEINEKDFEDETTMSCKSDFDEKEFGVDQHDKYTENTEEGQERSQLELWPKIALEDKTENNIKAKIVKNEDFQNKVNDTDKFEEMIKEMRDIKQKMEDLPSIRNTPNEDTATCPFSNQDTTAMCATHSYAIQIDMINDKLDSIINMYRSDMIEMKVLIKDFITTGKLSMEEHTKAANKQEAAKADSTYFSAEQISQLNDELKRFTDITLNETREIKEIIKDSAATSKTLQEAANLAYEQKANWILKQITETNISELRQVKDLIKTRTMPKEDSTTSTSTLQERKTVQISPTYFSADQISKLNSELKRISEKYQDTSIFPIIEVIPGAGDEHIVMKQLRKGVFYDSRGTEFCGKFKLGCGAFKRSDVIDIITEYPDLSLNEVVKEWIRYKEIWTEESKQFIWTPYMRRNDLKDYSLEL